MSIALAGASTVATATVAACALGHRCHCLHKLVGRLCQWSTIAPRQLQGLCDDALSPLSPMSPVPTFPVQETDPNLAPPAEEAYLEL